MPRSHSSRESRVVNIVRHHRRNAVKTKPRQKEINLRSKSIMLWQNRVPLLTSGIREMLLPLLMQRYDEI